MSESLLQHGASGYRRVVGCDGTPGQGPFMLFVLELQDSRIFDVKFQTYGCPAAEACGQFAAEWAEGKNLTEAAGLDEATLLEGTGPMPLGRSHCPGMAVRAMRKAIESQD